MHVLVTGGLGFIGGRLTRRLLDRGDRVTALDLPRFGVRSKPVGDGLSVRFVDILDGDAILPYFEGVDAVVHSAGVHHVDEVVRHPNRHVDVNVKGTLNVLDAAAQHGTRRMVQLSTAKVYGPSFDASRESDLVRPADEYALGKCVAETYCAHYAETRDMEVTAVRPFSVYGPGMDMRTGYCGALLDSLVTGGDPVLSGAADYSRDFVHVDTVVDVLLATLRLDADLPQIVNAGSGTSTSLAELVAIFSCHAGRQLHPTYSEPRPGTLDRTLADVSLMNELASPDVPDLASGIAETVHALWNSA